jgi:hypothetical protein
MVKRHDPGAIFLLAMVSLIGAVSTPLVPGWLLSFQDNWLAVLFKLNAGFGLN